MRDAPAYLKAARAYGIPAALEVSQSGRGVFPHLFMTAIRTAKSSGVTHESRRRARGLARGDDHRRPHHRVYSNYGSSR